MYDEFFGIEESEQYAFYRVPKLLFTTDRFWNLSTDAKMLYGLLLDRMSLSQKNGWVDEQGRVYIIYTIENIMEALGCGNKKAIGLLAELENKANLILRKKQGLGKPNLIYVKKFTVVANTPVERHFLKCQNDTSGNGQSTSLGVSKEHSNKPRNYAELLKKMDELGFEFKDGKQPAFRGKGQKRFIRLRSLGEDYSDEELRAVIAGKSRRKPRSATRQASAPKQFNLLIDIQAKMAEGKSAGYERWAKKYNRKEAARTVCLLKEKGVDSYEDLVALTDKLTSRFSELSSDIKAAEKRMAEIGVLQTHINNYSKTRKTYEAYRKSGYSKKFFEEHRDELMLHKAAKQAFDQLEGKKVPSRKALHEEFNQLLVEKKQAYAEYRQVKKDMQEYLIAKQTVETILNIDKKKEQEKEQKKPLR